MQQAPKMATARTAPTMQQGPLRLLSLSDDLLRCVLRHLSLGDRLDCAQTCRRCARMARSVTVLLASLIVGAFPNELNGVGLGRPDRQRGIADMRIDAKNPNSIPGSMNLAQAVWPWAQALRNGLDMLHRAFRMSAAQVGVHSLRLQRHKALEPLLRGLLVLIEHTLGPERPPHVCSTELVEVTLCQCRVPANLGTLLSRVASLRLYSCVVDPGEGAALADNLAEAGHETFCWVGERAGSVPVELLLAPRERPPKKLALSLGETMQLAALSEGAWPELSSVWQTLCGTGLEQLVLVGTLEDHPSQDDELIKGLADQLPLWSSLTTLFLDSTLFTMLASSPGSGDPAHPIDQPIGSSNSWQFEVERFLRALPPGLESLGTVDCLWSSPTWFFDALKAVVGGDEMSGDGAAGSWHEEVLAVRRQRPLGRLTKLAVYINSPGSTLVPGRAEDQGEQEPGEQEPGFQGYPNAVGDFGARCDFEDGCALHAVCCHARGLLPSLQTLLIDWYDEDPMLPEGLARALEPLGGIPDLRAVHFCQQSINSAELHTDASFPYKLRAAAELPGVRICVHEDLSDREKRGDRSDVPAGEIPGGSWLLHDSVGMLEFTRGLLPLSEQLGYSRADFHAVHLNPGPCMQSPENSEPQSEEES